MGLKDLVIKVTPPLVLSMDWSKAHPIHYTTTLYDENGKLRDDGYTKDNERSYWESFIDPLQAKELERRLALVESEDYIPGSEVFEQMPDVPKIRTENDND